MFPKSGAGGSGLTRELSSSLEFQTHSHFQPMANQHDGGHGTNPKIPPTSFAAFHRHNSSPPAGLINHGGGIGMRSWDDDNHSIVFSMAQNKHDITDAESQFQFSLGMTSSMENTVQMMSSSSIPADSVPCKIRAKRGCATHPRSIAERERRTRISGKLKKLHDLVPNMDKQTSYADMLDLAVQHIKTLQTKVQKLNGELERCTCGCKNTTHL